MLDDLDEAILLAENYTEWADALCGRLTAAGRSEDAAYACALVELGRARLAVLRHARGRLLSRSWPREDGGAWRVLLVRTFRHRARRQKVFPGKQSGDEIAHGCGARQTSLW
jgi:hypothetical protein